MLTRSTLAVAVLLVAVGISAAQTSPLDKLQAAQIPVEEREGLPPEVVAVVGNSRGWTKLPGFHFINRLQVTSPGRMISEFGSGIQLWDLETLRVLHSNVPSDLFSSNVHHAASVVAVSANGKRMAGFAWQSVGGGGHLFGPIQTSTFELWKVRDGKLWPVEVLSYSWLMLDDSAVFQDKTDKLIACGIELVDVDWVPRVGIWDLSTRPIKLEKVVSLKDLPLLAKTKITGARLADHGRTVAVIAHDAPGPTGKRYIHFVDLLTEKVTKTIALPGSSAVTMFRLSDDNRRLVTVEEDFHIRAYDLKEPAAKLDYSGSKLSVFGARFAMDSAGRKLAYIGTDAKVVPEIIKRGDKFYSVRLVDLTLPKPKEQFLDDDRCYLGSEPFTMTVDGKTLVIAPPGTVGRVEAWDLTGEKPIKRFAKSGHEGTITGLAFSPDGKSLLTGGWTDRQLCLWNLDGGKPALKQMVKDRGGMASLTPVPGSSLWAVSGSEPGGMSLWKLESGKLKLAAQLPEQPERVWQTACSPDGQWLFSACGPPWIYVFEGVKKEIDPDAGLGVWQRKGDKVEFKGLLPGHKGGVYAVAVSPNGKLLISAGGWRTNNEKYEPEEFGEVLVWDLTGAKPTMIAKLPGHNNVVSRVVFAADGKTLATASGDTKVRLWKVDDKKITAGKVLYEPDFGADFLAFSPDGKMLLSGDSRGELMLWNVETGNCRHSWRLNHSIGCVAFAPDGRHFATGNEWGTAYIFRVPQEKK